MTTYLNNSYYGGHIIEEDEDLETTKIICDLCEQTCTDDFILDAITASLSICVCRECHDQDSIEYQSIIEYVKSKKS